MKNLETQELGAKNLDKVSGGSVVRVNYSCSGYDDPEKRIEETLYGVKSENGEFCGAPYKRFKEASKTDKQLGGSDELTEN